MMHYYHVYSYNMTMTELAHISRKNPNLKLPLNLCWSKRYVVDKRLPHVGVMCNQWGLCDRSHLRPLTKSNTVKQFVWYALGFWQERKLTRTRITISVIMHYLCEVVDCLCAIIQFLYAQVNQMKVTEREHRFILCCETSVCQHKIY